MAGADRGAHVHFRVTEFARRRQSGRGPRGEFLVGPGVQAHPVHGFAPVRLQCPGRPPVTERCFNKLKHHKALATRYDKRARHYQAMVTIACLLLWLP